MDGLRINDGLAVVIRYISDHTNAGLDMLRPMSSTELRDNPHNHFVQPLDIISLSYKEVRTGVLVVMPKLYSGDGIPFDTVEQCLEFAKQTLEVRLLASLIIIDDTQIYV
jgi:hypothetical protein